MSRAVLTACAVAWLAIGCSDATKYPAIDIESSTSPSPSDFSSETTLVDREAAITAAYEQGLGGTFAGVDGVSINYRAFPVAGAKAAIVFVPGRTEPIRKHAETFIDLNRLGYAVFAIDPRGQGESGRMLADPQIGHVEYFSDYVTDLDTFVETIVAPMGYPRLFLLAHSMGGGISLMYVHRHPTRFTAVAVSSPMIGIDTGAFPTSLATDLAVSGCSQGRGDSYAPGQADFTPDTFADNFVTHSQPRFDFLAQLFAARPELRVGGVSYRWLCEALTATAHLRAVADESQPPTLVLEAGDDQIVNVDAEDEFCAAAPRCQTLRYADAFHEILSERDDIRNHALAHVVRFFDHFADAP